MKLKVNDKIFFSDKWGYTNPGVVIDTNYTLKYGGPIVDGKITDLYGLVKVLSLVVDLFATALLPSVAVMVILGLVLSTEFTA